MSSGLRGGVPFGIARHGDSAHRRMALAKDAEDKERIKAERLREALRANLRRRKAKPPASAAKDETAAPVTEKIRPKA
jgi:predicted amino acid dehydrogenase